MISRSLTIGRLGLERLVKRFMPTAAILSYHRIARSEPDPWGLCVRPERFAEHLAVLGRIARPISLSQLASEQAAGRITDRAVAITFDDGYTDNFAHAKPLLEAHEIPATVFAVSGSIDSGAEFWWDRLERSLLGPNALPAELTLAVGGRVQRWSLGSAMDYTEQQRRADRNCRPWNSPAGSRLHFFYSIWQWLRPLADQQRRSLLSVIAEWAGDRSSDRASHRGMSAAELRAWSAAGLLEVGAHTTTHACLKLLPKAEQADEIGQGKSELEQLLGESIRSFAYPFGEYTDETVKLVAEAGFDCACALTETALWRRSNPFELPRFPVEDWEGGEFERRLLRWLKC